MGGDNLERENREQKEIRNRQPRQILGVKGEVEGTG